MRLDVSDFSVIATPRRICTGYALADDVIKSDVNLYADFNAVFEQHAFQHSEPDLERYTDSQPNSNCQRHADVQLVRYGDWYGHADTDSLVFEHRHSQQHWYSDRDWLDNAVFDLYTFR